MLPTLSRTSRLASGAMLALALLMAPPAGAGADDLGSSQSRIKGLLVVDLEGNGFAAKVSQMNATATAAESSDAPFEIRFNQPVGPEMTGALNEVGKFLHVRHGGWPPGHEVEIAFEDRYTDKDGPSAAVACALLLDALVTGTPLADDFAVTGDMNADGAVRPVGGVVAKVRGAAKRGCTAIGIPADSVRALSDLLILEGPNPLFAVQVIALGTFDEALAVAKAERPAEVASALATFHEVQEVLARQPERAAGLLRNAAVQERLRAVLDAVPGHLSARLLLLHGLGRSGDSLSLPGSFGALDQAAAAIIRAAREDRATGASTSALELDAVGDALSDLRRLRPHLDRRILSYASALEDFGTLLRGWTLDPPSSDNERARLAEKLGAAAAKVDVELERLRRDREIMEEML